MPFTLAHPAAVLPLLKTESKWLFPTALALGTMAPDFEYFIYLKPYSTIGHLPLGFVLINLPFCLLLYILWEGLIRRPLIMYLPTVLARRLNKLCLIRNRLNSFEQFIVFCYSALLGMSTHVFWDSFTHESGFFVMRLSWLSHSLLGVPIYKYLQHGSSLMGFACLFTFLLRLKQQKTPPLPILRQKVRFWIAIVLLSGFIWIGFLGLFQLTAVGSLIIALINAFFLSTLLCCGISQLKRSSLGLLKR